MKERSELRLHGQVMRERLFGTDAAPSAESTGFDDLMTELMFGSIWSRPGLSVHDRMLFTITALFSRQQNEQLHRYIRAAVRIGIAPLTISEVLLQCGIYAGFSNSEEALAIARAVYKEEGKVIPEDPRREDLLENLTARAEHVMSQLHAERKHEGHAAPDNPTTKLFYPLVAQYCYGEIWDRPGLDMRTRALCAVASFAALGYTYLLRKLSLSALNVGATREEVIETVIQVGPYSGFAAALNALTQVQEVYAS